MTLSRLNVRFLPKRLVFDRGHPEVEWIATDGARFHEPFFEHTLGRLRRSMLAAERRTGTDALIASNSSSIAIEPAAFIFHVSRCGSTLVTQMLAALDRTIVISEAPVLDDILRAHRHDSSITDADRIAWLKGAVTSICRGVAEASDRAFIKLDAWNIFELDLVRRAYSRTPFLFVFRDPLEVVVSLMRMPSISLVWGTVELDDLGISADERASLAREDYAAAVVGAYYREASRHAAQLVPLAYRDLPSGLWERLPGFAFSEDDVETMRTAALRHSKAPHQAFVPDVDEKRRSASPEIHAACARWTDEPYRRWMAATAQ